ncbi:FAD-dependent oxidoreductase [Cytobacillus sp. Hz8]|uniref:oxidoreductase n=1 Tax=Cytobacillus sp. Hz8 TaxID=3347168 RepID=UPI0035DFEFB1
MNSCLFTTIKIGNLEISNRFVVPPMITNFCNPNGTTTERYIAYHEARAKGGWGLIITEATAVDPRGRGFQQEAGLWNDQQIESHQRLTERIHKYNSKIFAQIFHAGRQTSKKVIGMQPVAPSPIPCPMKKEIPHELTIDEIKDIVEKYGDAALRAKKAGYDGVEIHGSHGYLVAEFISSFSNKRTDRYGGCLANRLRFPLEIIENVRKKVGPDFPVGIRISADEFVPGGNTIVDARAIAARLEQAGVDVIHVSGGNYASTDRFIPPAAVEHGNLTSLAAEIKKVVSIPVITVSRINDPLIAESILVAGIADFTAMGRASLADPELPNKTAEGKYDEIVTCIGCTQGCLKRLFEDVSLQCLVNPALGRERELEVKPADVKKKVVIAGGGPAGMEAAIVAAQAGHEVHLFEKDSRLGGQFYIGSIPPSKGEISKFINWQINQLQKWNVNVHLKTEVTVDLVKEQHPDAVIVATGGKPLIPNIPGVNNPNVVNAFDVLEGKVDVDDRVLVIGGGQVGAETASHLGTYGRQVTIVEALSGIARDCEPLPKIYLLKDLEDKKVTLFVNTTVKRILPNGVVVTKDNEEFIIPADTVVLAVGAQPINELAAQLEKESFPVKTIGDAVRIRQAVEAIDEGYLAGLNVSSKKVLVNI